jgi:hypothetical protein
MIGECRLARMMDTSFSAVCAAVSEACAFNSGCDHRLWVDLWPEQRSTLTFTRGPPFSSPPAAPTFRLQRHIITGWPRVYLDVGTGGYKPTITERTFDEDLQPVFGSSSDTLHSRTKTECSGYVPILAITTSIQFCHPTSSTSPRILVTSATIFLQHLPDSSEATLFHT